jgi:hypothetical protein
MMNLYEHVIPQQVLVHMPPPQCSIPGGGNDGTFFLRYRVQTGTGAHPASYPINTGGSNSREKAAGAWSW